MKRALTSILPSFVWIAFVFTSTACTPRLDSAKSGEPGTSTIDTSAADKAAADAKKAAENARDIISGGGQPGTVSILGPLAEEVGVQDSHISIGQTTGRSWRATTPNLDDKSLNKSIELTDSELKEIEEAKMLKTIVYVGCEKFAGTTSLLPAGDLEPVTFQSTPSDTITKIKANIVFICGEAAFPNRFTMIVAKKVYLNGFRLELTGGPSNGLTIIASDLLLSGLSFITTRAPSGPITVSAGPSVSISALRIGDTNGGESRVGQDDQIQIKVYGADYKEDKKP